MQDIIVEELLKIFDIAKDSVCVETYDVSEKCFDLLDKQENSICEESKGNVTYKNETENSIFVFNYEKFIESLPDEKKKGIKHCDFIVASKNSFIICNELSGGNSKSKWPKAWKQMQKTIKTLSNSDNVKEKFSKDPIRYCVFSVRNNKIATPLGIADSFSKPIELIQTVQEREWYPINQLGFKVFEADFITYKEDGSIVLKCI